MNRCFMGIGVIGLAVFAAAGAWVMTQQGQAAGQEPGMKAGEPEQDDDEVVIKLTDAPEAVRAAVLKMTAEKNIRQITKEQDDDVVTYEVDYSDNGASASAVLTSAGDVIETEKQVQPSSLPSAAMAAIKKQYENAPLGDIHLVTKTFYEVDVTIDGKKNEVVVDPSGKIKNRHGNHEQDEGHQDKD